MPEKLDEYTPKWTQPEPEGGVRVPEDGWHLLFVRVVEATFENVGRAKPYMNCRVVVSSGEYSGITFDLQIYLNLEAEKWARYALSKFGYPKDLLSAHPPVIKLAAVIGLEAQVLVLISSESGLKEFDVKAYGHADGDAELDKRYAKECRTVEQEPTVDINEDVRQATEYTPTDNDFPANMFPPAKHDEWPD